jgi:hypothetical protein
MQPVRRKKQLVTKWITVPGNLTRGCDDFNTGKFYESHEHFEEIWQYERGSCRNAYKGLIHVAAGFVHLSRRKYPGSERLFRTALAYLGPYRVGGAVGFDIEAVCQDVESMYQRVLASGPAGLAEIDIARRPTFAFDPLALSRHALRDSAWGFDDKGKALEMEITVAE